MLVLSGVFNTRILDATNYANQDYIRVNYTLIVVYTMRLVTGSQSKNVSCSTVIGECIVSARPSPFSSLQIAHMLHIAYRAYITRYLGNAMQRRFSISAPGSVYDARCEPDFQRCQI
jgi:hypothetical protein